MSGASLYTAPDLYDAEFGGYRADLAFYRHAVACHPGRILELGCGTGRLARLLSRPDVVGLDVAAPMLRAWRARDLHAQLVCGAMDAVPLKAGCAALVVMAYNLVQHCTTGVMLQRVLDGARLLLAPGGGLALDMFMPPHPGPQRRDVDFAGAERRTDRHGRALDVAERTVVDGTVQTTQLRFEDVTGGAAQVYAFARTLWSHHAVEDALERAGLTVVEKWGDVDGAPFTPASPRWMARAVAALPPPGPAHR